MPGFIVWVRPSRQLKILAIGLHSLTLLAIMLYFSGWERLVWLAGLLCCTGWAFYYLRQPVIKRIAIDEKLQAQLTLTKKSVTTAAELMADSMVRRSILALNWHTSEGKVTILLLPDMIDEQSWRKLQVWARWCQPQKTPSGFRRFVSRKNVHLYQPTDKQ